MMKAVQIIDRGKPIFVDVPMPELKSGYARIRTKRVSLCGSDIRWIHHLSDEAYPSAPGTTGHEMVGVIDAIEDSNSEFSVGDYVLALAPDHRAMAEFYLASVDNLIKLPPGISLELLVQAQQLGTVIYACKHLGHVAGKTIAVIGQGSAGLWFDFMLNRMGAARIIGIDLVEERLKVSKFFGVQHTILNQDNVNLTSAVKAANDGNLPDIVVQAAGEAETVRLAVELVKDYGRILYFGVPHVETLDFPFMTYFIKCCEASSICHAIREPGHQSTREALEMITTGEIDAEPVITHRLPFTAVKDAYRLHWLREDGAIKIIVNMDEM